MQTIPGSVRARFRGFAPGDLARLALVAVPALAAASVLVWLLETQLGARA